MRRVLKMVDMGFLVIFRREQEGLKGWIRVELAKGLALVYVYLIPPFLSLSPVDQSKESG